MRALRGGFLVLAFLPYGAALSEPATQVWVNPGVYALHFDRDKDLRDDNIGLGVELAVLPAHAFMAGSYINSNRARSRYGAYAWRPLQYRFWGLDLLAGIVVGAFDGYPNYRDGGWFLAPLPLLALEGRRLGANLSLIPTLPGRLDGAFAVQLKLRVW
jgi:hypothetical protein